MTVEDEQYSREIKSYYIELMYNFDSHIDSRCWWDFDRRDVHKQLSEIVQIHQDDPNSTVNILGRVNQRLIASSLKDVYSYFEFINNDEDALRNKELPPYTDFIIYHNSWLDDKEHYYDYDEFGANGLYMSAEEKQSKGIGWINDIELISFIALVVE